MVDVSAKASSRRQAVASAFVALTPAVLGALPKNPKGDPLEVARLAGIMATKRTADLIPLCHSLGLDAASVDLRAGGDRTLRIESTVRVQGRTGVEMEALTAVSVAALTVYDMCKSIDRGMVITGIRLLEKQGGRSGTWTVAEIGDSEASRPD